MGQVIDVLTDEKYDLVQALKWSSVGSSTGVGCFSVDTSNSGQINDIRGIIRMFSYGRRCYESFSRRAILKNFSFTAFFPCSTKYVGIDKFIYWLFLCNSGLQDTGWQSVSKKFPDDHPNPRTRGPEIPGFPAHVPQKLSF